MRQVAACFAELDQRFQAHAALEDVFFAEHRVVQAKLFHQGAFFGFADFHAQGFDLFRGFHHGLAYQVVLNVGHVYFAFGFVGYFRLAAAFGTAGSDCAAFDFSRCVFGRATGLFLRRGGLGEQGVGGFNKFGLTGLDGHGGNFLRRQIRFRDGFRWQWAGYWVGKCFWRRFFGCFLRCFNSCFDGSFHQRCCGYGGFFDFFNRACLHRFCSLRRFFSGWRCLGLDGWLFGLLQRHLKLSGCQKNL